MADNFYNRITRKIGRGAGADRISESIGGAAQKAGDSLQEQQAVQDYQKGMAGSELGQSLTKAAGEAALAYGQARKDFKTNALTSLKLAEVNELKAKIDAETNPEKQAKLIEEAKIKSVEFSSKLRQELGDLGYGGADLEQRAGVLNGEFNKMVRDTSKANMEAMSKVQQEMFKQQVNLAVNDAGKNYLTPLGDSDGIRKAMAAATARCGQGSLCEITAHKNIMSDGIKKRLNVGINTAENPKWALQYLNSKGPKQFLTESEHSAFMKKAKKATEEGKSPVKRTVKLISKIDPNDMSQVKIMKEKINSDSSFDADTREVFNGFFGAMEKGLNGRPPKFLQNGDLLLNQLLKDKKQLGVEDTAIIYKAISGLYKGVGDQWSSNPNDVREMMGVPVKGLKSTQLETLDKSIDKSFESGNPPTNQIQGLENKTAFAAASAQTPFGEKGTRYRIMRLALDSGNKRLDSFRKSYSKGEMISHNQSFKKIIKDKFVFNSMTEGHSDEAIIKDLPNSDVEQLKFEAVFLGLVDAKEYYGDKWGALEPWIKLKNVHTYADDRMHDILRRKK